MSKRRRNRIAWPMGIALGLLLLAPSIAAEPRQVELSVPKGIWAGPGPGGGSDYAILGIAGGKGSDGERRAMYLETSVAGCDDGPLVAIGFAASNPVLDNGITIGFSIDLDDTVGCLRSDGSLAPIQGDFGDFFSFERIDGEMHPQFGDVPRPLLPACGEGMTTIEGTDRKDTLVGTDGNDIIEGFGGKDTIDGGNGHDIICGGRSRDTLIGGFGVDFMYGGPGKDTISGDDGPDFLVGEEKGDVISGGDGDDTLLGDGRKDLLIGDLGTDYADGGTDAAAQNSVERDACDAEFEINCEREP